MKVVRNGWQRPEVWFVALIGVLIVRELVTGPGGGMPSAREDYGYRLAFGYLAAWFVASDVRTRRRAGGWPADHMMVGALVLLPVYLLTTRGVLGGLVLVGLLAGLAAPAFVAALVR